MKVVRKSVVERYLTEEDALIVHIEILRQGYRNVREFAKKVGISEPYLSMLLHGKRNVTEDLIEKFNKAGVALKKKLIE